MVIFAYTRAQATLDGVLVDVSELAKVRTDNGSPICFRQRIAEFSTA